MKQQGGEAVSVVEAGGPEVGVQVELDTALSLLTLHHLFVFFLI